MITFEEFDFELMRTLDERYPTVKKTRRMQYRFNETKQGVVIVCSDEIQPVVYPDNLYQAYQEMEDMDVIMQIIESAIKYEKLARFREIAKDWNQAKKYIHPYVVNLERNMDCIERHEYVYKQKLNLAYGVYLELPEEPSEGNAIITITKDLLKLWDVSEAEAFEVAENNAEYSVRPMREVIKELMAGLDYEYDESEEERMYVVTNERRHRGAAGMFDMELLARASEELDSDFYILPSSMHEVILVPASSGPSKEFLQEAVVEINHSQVNDEDYLSDNIYYYDRKTCMVDMVEFD